MPLYTLILAEEPKGCFINAGSAVFQGSNYFWRYHDVAVKWALEDHVDDWVKDQLKALGLKNRTDFRVKSDMSDFFKEALRGSSKTKNKTDSDTPGEPDVHVEKYGVPVIFEDKLGLRNLKKATSEAIHYAQYAVSSGRYSEAFAIGVAGNDEENVKYEVYYVFDSITEPKKIEQSSFNFLENEETFNIFYRNAILSEEERHNILIKSQKNIQKAANELSELMVDHSINANERVIYVSGMLLSMQDIKNENGKVIKSGLTPDSLKGIMTDEDRDGIKVVRQIKSYLSHKKVLSDNLELMLGSFSVISLDKDRDEKTTLHNKVSKFINGEASINKQIFCYIYETIFVKIDGTRGHLDIVGEMYSIFLKYALGDGKELGIVLTPPYVTKMMSQILDIDENSRVMDLATGSAAFLISSMEMMIQDVESKHGKDTSVSKEKIEHIKKHQLLGVENDRPMFTLAVTNMVLRGDGSSTIKKANTFTEPAELFNKFKPNRILLNPPFKHAEKGMPFIAEGLRFLEKGGIGALIVQDSAGSGEAITTNLKILKENQLLASIKMPIDLFVPYASVQTSIYVFEHTKKKHDHQKQVKFIDFRNDGYKRTKRNIKEMDNPTQRYQDIVEIYKNGVTANVSSDLWSLGNQVVMATISDEGNDWNFDQKQIIDTTPKENDFRKTVREYYAWEISNFLRGDIVHE